MASTLDCTTLAPPVLPARPCPAGLSFPQIRTTLANTAFKTYSRAELLDELAQHGATPVDGGAWLSKRALALRLAWALLPAGPETKKGGNR
jgi:hypothetical protein